MGLKRGREYGTLTNTKGVSLHVSLLSSGPVEFARQRFFGAVLFLLLPVSSIQPDALQAPVHPVLA